MDEDRNKDEEVGRSDEEMIGADEFDDEEDLDEDTDDEDDVEE